MPRPFERLTLDQFNDLVSQFQFARRIDTVHLHHTWLPDKSMYRGVASIEAIYQFHIAVKGWSDIAQHITIDPDGGIWTGRNWNDPPVRNGPDLGPRSFHHWVAAARNSHLQRK